MFLPEWPLPLEVYAPEVPTLALTARFRPFNVPVDLSGSEEFHFYHHGGEPSSHKIMVWKLLIYLCSFLAIYINQHSSPSAQNVCDCLKVLSPLLCCMLSSACLTAPQFDSAIVEWCAFLIRNVTKNIRCLQETGAAACSHFLKIICVRVCKSL